MVSALCQSLSRCKSESGSVDWCQRTGGFKSLTLKILRPVFYFAFLLAINGYVSDSSEILGFCQDNVVQWHFSSVGTHDEIVSVRLSGHSFLYQGKYEDVLNLFPMSGESVTVEMDNVGKW